MPNVLVEVPAALNTGGSIEFVDALGRLPHAEGYDFDFSAYDWAEPFGMLYASSGIRALKRRFPCSRFKAINFRGSNAKRLAYAGHMGFFHCFGLEVGKVPGGAPGSGGYLPITELTIRNVVDRASRTGDAIGELVDADATRLAAVLVQADVGNLFQTVQYALREVIRNAMEHSESDSVFYCAQYWPKTKRVQLAIMDSGIGIRASLQQNPHLRMEDDVGALKLALMPGISGKVIRQEDIRPYDGWQNSGYGLYMIYRLCRAIGSLTVSTNEAVMNIVSGEDATFEPRKMLSGTAIKVSFDVHHLRDLTEELQIFGREGREIAAEKPNGSVLTASSASLGLRRP